MLSRHMLLKWLMIVVCLSASACMTGRGRPPGTVQQQRYQATLHDPYPDGDGGPEVVGGRPREFQKPLAEPVRNRWLQDSWWNP
jgi:hypothetical protein